MRLIKPMYLLLACVAGWAAPNAFATEAQARPPWLQPEVLRAAGAMQLTQAQMPQFKTAVSDLVNNRLRAINKLLRKNNQSNLERKIKSATNRQFKKMDKHMAGFLSEEQMVAYQGYRAALKDSMAAAAKARSRSSSDAKQSASAALNGLGQSN